MKKFLTTLATTGAVVLLATSSFAVPYTGADIELDGNQYGWASARWFDGTASDSIATNWAGESVRYDAGALAAGDYNIGVNVSNNGIGNLGDGWYLNFELYSLGTGVTTLLTIPASDTEIHNGYFAQTLSVNASSYSVQYTWMNDKYAPGKGLDANIQIHSAFFDNLDTPGGNDGAPVPEPATMLLFGSGLAGLLCYNRKRKK